jgi:hypothetical protein
MYQTNNRSFSFFGSFRRGLRRLRRYSYSFDFHKFFSSLDLYEPQQTLEEPELEQLNA